MSGRDWLTRTRVMCRVSPLYVPNCLSSQRMSCKLPDARGAVHRVTCSQALSHWLLVAMDRCGFDEGFSETRTCMLLSAFNPDCPFLSHGAAGARLLASLLPLHLLTLLYPSKHASSVSAGDYERRNIQKEPIDDFVWFCRVAGSRNGRTPWQAPPLRNWASCWPCLPAGSCGCTTWLILARSKVGVSWK